MTRTLLHLIVTCVVSAAPAAAQREARIGYKDPGTATLVSLAIPGGGQLYSGETGRGAALLGVSLGGVALGVSATVSSAGVSCDEAFNCQDDTNYLPMALGYAVFLGSWIYGVIDADDSAQRMNARRGLVGGFPPRLSPVITADPQRATRMGLSIRF
ncbi:MAG: hypothetical protein AVDCRST_MAG68-2397 [uncultured Gemmatimonadetes bacterium]|uniref:DUF5683 domain-containing protein n=1 Tax=uncultured Gemmatimonadota bacterium TaxID=203437 RepID=A0A6J4LBM4_9BACT|nr:MAG: hypothetical protein AVDCRST_MAG68-2397 [uncultured Gemmatimonadota bacterium]